MRHRSASQLSSVLGCSEQFRLERLVKPKPPKRPAAWLALGTAAHEALADWERSGRESDPLSRFAELYDQEIANLQEEQPDLGMWLKPFKTKSVEKDIDLRRAEGFKQVNNYVEDALSSPWEVWQPEWQEWPAVEVGFTVQLGEVEVVGDIDLIQWWPQQRQHVIRDLKTGNREKNRYQLATYGYAAQKIFGLDIDYGEYFYLKDGGSSGWVDLSRYTEKYLTDIYESLDKQINQGLFIPNPGERCGICPVQQFCREMGDMVTDG